MNRINLVKSFTQTRNSIAWGKNSSGKASWSSALRNNSGPVIFAGLLIVCSIAVGCSSDKPKPVSNNNPITQAPSPSTIATSSLPALTPEPAKPAPKKVVKKKPATVTYTDKTYGVSFDYPRRYAIETGDAAKDLLVSSPVPMNFVQPGGVALAAVELPETGFANTDFSSAFFNVSVNNTLTADQCVQFSVPEPKPVAPSTQSTEVASASVAPEPQGTKLMLGDMELRGTEAVSGEGSRQSDSKYFHLFQNNACYEFELNVTTNAAENAAGMKHVDRDRVFSRLESILATVKINPIAPAPTPEVVASQPASSAPAPEVIANTPVAQPVAPEAAASTPATPASAPDAPANAPVAKEATAAQAAPAAPDPSPQK
jgi:hypothetical protein